MTAMQLQTEPSASRSSAELVLCPPTAARSLTIQQQGWLVDSLRGDERNTLETLLADIEREMAQLWAVRIAGEAQAFLVTRLKWYAQCCALEIHLCGGVGMSRWFHLLPELEQHARNLGCRYVELCGRRGWERVLEGYDVLGVTLAKDLA